MHSRGGCHGRIGHGGTLQGLGPIGLAHPPSPTDCQLRTRQFTDLVGRALMQPLQGALGQPVVVENRSGASGHVGSEAVVKSAPDGHTLLVTAGSTILIGPLINKMPFDVNRDLTPEATIARLSVLLITWAISRPRMSKSRWST